MIGAPEDNNKSWESPGQALLLMKLMEGPSRSWLPVWCRLLGPSLFEGRSRGAPLSLYDETASVLKFSEALG